MPPLSTNFTLTVNVVFTEVLTPSASSICYPGFLCNVTVSPSQGRNASTFFIQLLDSTRTSVRDTGASRLWEIGCWLAASLGRV